MENSKEVTMYRSEDGKLWETKEEMELRDAELDFDKLAENWANQEKKPSSAIRHRRAIVRFLLWRRKSDQV